MTELPYASLSLPAAWDRGGLPGWAYRSPALFDLERRELFLTHWQVVGHEADIPAPGDWLGFDMLGERAVVMRGQDGAVRAFHNLCRHRGARVVAGEQGHCRGALVCPFHGWVYNLDGSLRGAAQPTSFGSGFDRAKFGLQPIELESFHGFLFLRFHRGPQPAIAEMLAPYAGDFAAYRAETLLPVPAATATTLPVNWKSVRDVDNEGYHVPLAHPALQELYGRDYRDIHFPDHGLNISLGFYGDAPGRRWSVRNYVKLSEPAPHLPPHLRRSWSYYGLFPNAVIAFTPEGAQFYQEIPVSPSETKLTGRLYRRPDESRRQRAARYLAQRIDRDTSAEDRQLSIWSDESMRSSAFQGFHLSDLEWGLRRHHDALRALLPVLRLEQPPPEAEIAARNAELICRTGAPG